MSAQVVQLVGWNANWSEKESPGGGIEGATMYFKIVGCLTARQLSKVNLCQPQRGEGMKTLRRLRMANKTPSYVTQLQ